MFVVDLLMNMISMIAAEIHFRSFDFMIESLCVNSVEAKVRINYEKKKLCYDRRLRLILKF